MTTIKDEEKYLKDKKLELHKEILKAVLKFGKETGLEPKRVELRVDHALGWGMFVHELDIRGGNVPEYLSVSEDSIISEE